jgi:hypothetical protein
VTSGRAPGNPDLIESYLLAKLAIVEAGFEGELAWQERQRVETVDERLFLAEAAWVVLSSGMRESVVRKVFPAVEAAFQGWVSAAWIVKHSVECRSQAAWLRRLRPRCRRRSLPSRRLLLRRCQARAGHQGRRLAADLDR